MIPSNYDGPSNGDYAAYVDKLMRASPDFRRAQRSIAGAIESSVSMPGVQADSPVALLREKLQQARDMVEQQAEQQAHVKSDAQRKFGIAGNAVQRKMQHLAHRKLGFPRPARRR